MSSESEAAAQGVRRMIEDAGLGPIKVLIFRGEPTTDLIVETDDPDAVCTRIQTLLAGLPVSVVNGGRPGDLRWHRILWRHL